MPGQNSLFYAFDAAHTAGERLKHPSEANFGSKEYKNISSTCFADEFVRKAGQQRERKTVAGELIAGTS